MKVFRYWARREQHFKDPEDFAFFLRAWGGSNVDPADAAAQAQSRLDRWVEKLRGGMDAFFDSVDYPYGHDQLREELLDGEPVDSGFGWVVTRTRAGTEVLNATQLAILDIDLHPRGFVAWLKSLFASKAMRVVQAIAQVEQWVAVRPEAGVRLYRTPAGFRAILTHRRFEPDSAEIVAIMSELRVDPLYARLCKRQGCFRARLTAKPWRIGVDRIKLNPVPAGEWRGERDQRWLDTYRAKSGGHAACAWIADFGQRDESDHALTSLIALHDERSGALSGRPLA